jgi:hypothetical protein
MSRAYHDDYKFFSIIHDLMSHSGLFYFIHKKDMHILNKRPIVEMVKKNSSSQQNTYLQGMKAFYLFGVA